MGRFSDEQLKQFHDEFQHHIELYGERVKTDDARHEALLKAQEVNAKQLQELITNTQDIVEFYKDIKGAARIGMAIQRMGLWLAKWGIIGSMFYAAYGWL